MMVCMEKEHHREEHGKQNTEEELHSCPEHEATLERERRKVRKAHEHKCSFQTAAAENKLWPCAFAPYEDKWAALRGNVTRKEVLMFCE